MVETLNHNLTLKRPVMLRGVSNFKLINNIGNVSEEKVKLYLKNEYLVKEWIEKVLSIKLENSLYESLKNGVVLCNLINSIQSDTVPLIVTKTKFGHEFKNNIEYFLLGLRDFQFPPQKLFVLDDLYKGENIVRVVECLSVLAKLACEKKEFTIEIGNNVSSNIQIQLPKDDELVNLKLLLSQIKDYNSNKSTNTFNNNSNNNNNNRQSNYATLRPTPSTPLSSTTTSTSNSSKSSTQTPTSQQTQLKNQQNEELIKSKIEQLKKIRANFIKFQNGIIKFQALWKGHKVRQNHIKIKRNLIFRKKIIDEIFKTEMDYVKNLNTCIKYYMEPMLQKEIITKEQCRNIFSDIVIIYNFGNSFLQQLKERCGDNYKTHYQKFSDMFISISSFLKVYSNYVENYDNSLTTLKELRKSDKFNSFITETLSKPEIDFYEIDSFLILPIQRVPRYFLLLNELVKNFEFDGHPDLIPLKEAAEKIKGVATFLNERKRKVENFQKFKEIQGNLIGKVPELFLPSRNFIKQIQFINSKLPSSQQDSIMFLFNDIIIMGKPKQNSKKIKFIGIIDLLQTVILNDDDDVNDNDGSSNTNGGGGATDNVNKFILNLHYSNGNGNLNGTSSNSSSNDNGIYSITLKNHLEKSNLKAEINKLIIQLKENKKTMQHVVVDESSISTNTTTTTSISNVNNSNDSGNSSSSIPSKNKKSLGKYSTIGHGFSISGSGSNSNNNSKNNSPTVPHKKSNSNTTNNNENNTTSTPSPPSSPSLFNTIFSSSSSSNKKKGTTVIVPPIDTQIGNSSTPSPNCLTPTTPIPASTTLQVPQLQYQQHHLHLEILSTPSTPSVSSSCDESDSTNRPKLTRKKKFENLLVTTNIDGSVGDTISLSNRSDDYSSGDDESSISTSTTTNSNDQQQQDDSSIRNRSKSTPSRISKKIAGHLTLLRRKSKHQSQQINNTPQDEQQHNQQQQQQQCNNNVTIVEKQQQQKKNKPTTTTTTTTAVIEEDATAEDHSLNSTPLSTSNTSQTSSILTLSININSDDDEDDNHHHHQHHDEYQQQQQQQQQQQNSNNGSNEQYIAYETILQDKKNLNLDLLKLESYLNDQDFERLFKLSKSEFYKLSKWKQNKLKFDLKLY